MAVSQGLTPSIPFDSITFPGHSSNPVDRLYPLSFINWVSYNRPVYSTSEETLSQYQHYLNRWHIVNGSTAETQSNAVQNLYINLIKEIVLQYTSPDEQRYLTNLDFTNSRDLTLAVPFFSKKIKDICLYYSTLRDDVQTASLQYNLKGSNFGIEQLLYNAISRALNAEDITSLYSTLSLSLSDVRNNMIVSVEDIYDLYPNYFDNSPTVPVSAYNVTTGLRSEYFKENIIDIDPFLSLDFNQSIARAILDYPFFLQELGDQLSITPAVKPTDLNYLKDSDFATGINDGKQSNLNLTYEAVEQSKYIGSDFYYVITDSTLTSFTSGVLFSSNSDFANILNKRFPTIAAIPSQEFLKTAKEVGLFFKPDKIGLLHFTNFNFSASVDLSKLQPNTVYYFPDPYKYGNISGGTKQEFVTPFKFFEDNSFNKVDLSNQFKAGDVTSDPYYQLFRAYQSREQSLNYSNFGISRSVDYQDFFSGDQDLLWGNIDVYPHTPVGIFPIDERTQKLLSIDKTLVQYKNDIFGNEYGLYKDGHPGKSPNYSAVQVIYTDLVLDGYVFFDAVAGYNFDYSTTDAVYQNLTIKNPYEYGDKMYSGVTLNTIGTDGLYNTSTYTPQQLTAYALTHPLPYSGTPPTTITNGFTLTGNIFIMQSYGFTTESFASVYVSFRFNCNVKDAQTFLAPDGSRLPDTSSDLPGFNLETQQCYYAELAEAGTSPTSPNYIPDFTYGASFTTNIPLSTYVDYDCGAYLVDYYDSNFNVISNAEPCATNTNYAATFNEDSVFVDIRTPGKTTTVDYSLSSSNRISRSLYNIKYTDFGDMYFRNANSTVILPVSSALSATFLKYNSSVVSELTSSMIINFDVFYDTLQIETQNYLIFDKIFFDYTTGTVVGDKISYSILSHDHDFLPTYEKFSTVWLDESTKQAVVVKTSLFSQLSTSNYKIIYPKIYSVDLNTLNTVQLFPYKPDTELTIDDLKLFSLSGQNVEIDIVEIEKPILSFNQDTNTYMLSYLAKDTSNAPYIVNIKFRYFNRKLDIISVTMFKPSQDTLHQNFGNYAVTSTTLPSFTTYTITGTAAGYIDNTDNTYTFSFNGALTPPLPVNFEIYMANESYTGLVLQEDDYSRIIV